MAFQPEDIQGQPSTIQDASTQENWLPMYSHDCTFDTSAFNKVMLNLVVNPNINSSWLFRADVLYDDLHLEAVTGDGTVKPVNTHFQGFNLKRTMVRRFIPRNEQRDEPMDQTCSFHEFSDGHVQKMLVIYIPHADSAGLIPFYHPKVRGIAHLHIYDQASGTGQISVHFLPFHDFPVSADKKTQRTAFHLLEVLYKHGRGKTEGYVKRVNHDVVVPRARFQNKLAELKARYARPLVQSWVLKTDPSKHVFEDLAIAAFLMELWADMYVESEFPGFVDIGCGNGLLVYLLTQEGYKGWGFDARERISWEQYKTRTEASSSSPTGFSLEERLLLPAAVTKDLPKAGTGDKLDIDKVHDGMFPAGTFIISNHADELTPWTPILATMSKSPFIMIPCCSHSLTGNKYRAPPPRDKSKGTSTYASLVDWVSLIAEDCGWKAEMEVLRIPSTRNICILGRDRTKDYPETDVDEVIRKNGGVDGFYENVVKLLKQGPRAH